MTTSHPAEASPLGKVNQYVDQYTASLLYPIARSIKWAELGFTATTLPYYGVDIWNGYELSWLTPSGKPEVVLVEFIIAADSPFIIESKSFKLYLNSYNQTVFPSKEAVQQTLQKDLTQATGKPVKVNLFSLTDIGNYQIHPITGHCIDNTEVNISQYDQPSVNLLKKQPEFTKETLYSHLLKSNCPVTGQPDWATLIISYEATYKLDYASLLQYIVSFRCHADFHEQCVERIFIDLLEVLQPQQLIVMARYTRRGGLDINPCRSLQVIDFQNQRLVRQ